MDTRDENTGSEVVRFLQKRTTILNVKRIVVHSLNTPARERMVKDLKKIGFFVTDAPFTMIDWESISNAWKL